MSELDFTNSLEAVLERGMASVALPALEPARARYRIAAAKAGRRSMPRLTIAIAAIGLALFTGVAGAAASGTSPATVMSAAVHRVVVFFEQITTPGELPGNPSPMVGGSEPPASGQEQGSIVPAGHPAETPAPAPTEAPAPAPTETPGPAPTDAPLASPPESPGPTDSPNPTLSTN